MKHNARDIRRRIDKGGAGDIRALTAERDALAADCKALGGTCTALAEENARLNGELRIRAGVIELQDAEMARRKEQVGLVALSEYAKGEEVTRLVAECERLKAEAQRLREALEEALPRWCESRCQHDDNYGSVKHHDLECANVRRLLGQNVDDSGRIQDAALSGGGE